MYILLWQYIIFNDLVRIHFQSLTISYKFSPSTQNYLASFMSINIYLYQIGKGEPKAKQVKLAQKARKPQAAKNGPKRPFPCDLCEFSSDRRSGLQMHIDAVHQGLKPFKCTQCDAAYGTNTQLTRHIKGAHENAYVCSTCNKSFASQNKLNEHIGAVHEGIKHKCDFCDETFSRKGSITRHVKKAHQN